MPELSDDDLVRLYWEGDVDAFDALFARHSRAVYGFARMMLGDSDGAEDVLQEAFLAVAQSAGAYRPRGRCRAWLLRIARNLCLTRIRAAQARRQAFAPDMAVGPQAPDPAPTPPRRAERREDIARLRVLIAGLPERQRVAILLYAFEQMSYREIAEVLDVPINTVKTLIHRARATLAQGLDHP
ncbi:MAG: RNA polymerase sigma factor [Candidatus Brocadiia bacterium]